MIIPHLVDNGWDGIWSAIVSSVAAAATALAIFYVQRRVDRRRGEDEATQVAIEEIRRATLILVDYIPGDGAQRRPNAERHQDWDNAVSLAKPRVHDAKAAQLVSQMQQVAGFYRERWIEFAQIKRKVPRNTHGEPEIPFRELAKLATLIEDYSQYLIDATNELARWSPSSKAISPQLTVSKGLKLSFHKLDLPEDFADVAREIGH
jgi:hypothetical protein